MKTAFVIFLIGVIAGAFGYYYIQHHQTGAQSAPSAVRPTAETAQPKPSLVEQARSEVKGTKDAIAAKLVEWHLTPEEIRSDISKTGQVVRTKARAAGETISNTRIEATIEAKYALDKELSARAIQIDCQDGHVTLSGTAASPSLIAKAIATALDTDGVLDVKSKIALAPESAR
jgi:uncharacterized membrane protein